MSSLALPLPSLPSQASVPSKGLNPSVANGNGSNATAGPSQPKKRASLANGNVNGNANGIGGPSSNAATKERSASPAEDEDEEEEEEDDEPRKKKKKTAKGTVLGEYKYSNEIAAMMFVFGEVQEPLPETVKLVEDVVRGQVIEIVTRARLLTHLRSSRFLSAEDLIFLIRDDRSKVNRLRTYLSWKDVRKKAKEDDAGPGAGADVDEELEDTDKAALKTRKTMVKLPWELMTPFSDFLKTLPTSMNKDEEDDDDDDEVQAHHDSMQRLREADEITRKMTKDEYVHYSDCRQASFTYRKARRFREFINFAAYLDVRPNDDIIDILGFLAFEMVRSLCVTALEVRERHEAPLRQAQSSVASTSKASGPNNTSPVKRKSTLLDSPNKRTRTSPELADRERERDQSTTRRHAPAPLFAPPPSARQPLTSTHVLEAYAQIQRQQAANRVGGMRNFRGGLAKGRMALV